MRIPLDDNLRLEGKELAWELQKRRIKNGVKCWRPIKYYRKLGHALSEVGERRIRLMPGDSIEDAIAAMDTVSRGLQRIINAILKTDACASYRNNRLDKATDFRESGTDGDDQ